MAQSTFPLSLLMALKQPLSRLTFSRQFVVVSFAVLLTGMIVIGTWLGRQIESNTVNRAAAIATVYVESILATQLDPLAGARGIDDATRASLDRVFVDGPLSRKVVRFKLWGPDGTIVYSSDSEQLGHRYPVEGMLAAAFAGTVHSRISHLGDSDNASERARWSELLEVYVPLRSKADNTVVTVAEFYHSTTNLGRDIRVAKQQSWVLVTVVTAAMYLLLLGIVRRADSTILDQQRDLSRQLQQLRTTVAENEQMRGQLREAVARTTALNEQFLHRVAADLHDGPAQEIALALMRLEALGETRYSEGGAQANAPYDFENIYRALNASLAELRNMAAGLGMPKIADLSLADTVRRAVRDFEEKSETTVQTEIDETLAEAPLALRITVYRFIQESLTNGWLHARGAAQQVRARRAGEQAHIEVTDQGPGFVPQAAFESGRLGLAFMRERVRILGGAFEVTSEPGRGTRVMARLPLSPAEAQHA